MSRFLIVAGGAIVIGLSLLLLIRIGAAFRARFRKIFLSHETTPIAFS